MSQSFLASKWVEVNIDVIKENYQLLRQNMHSNIKILGVVKADAYGLGAIEIGRVLEKMGINMLGVTTIEEGRELRQGGIKIPILVFGSFFPENIKDIIEQDLTITIANEEVLKWLSYELAGVRKKIKVHLKIETGMGRLGFWPNQAVGAARRINEISALELEGVYSHLATAMWADKSYAYEQFSKFQKAIADLKQEGFFDLLCHIANSAAAIKMPDMHLDMVRIGTLLYGQYPSPYIKKYITIKEPWSLKARVLSINELAPGYSVGYGRAFKTKRRTKIAVIPVGYVDGLQLEPLAKPSGFIDLCKVLAKTILRFFGYKKVQPYVMFKDGRGYIAGKVGMQLTMVDVTHLKGVEVGSEVFIPARRTAVNAMLPRIYVENQKVVSIGVKRSVTLYQQSIAAK